MEKHSVPHAMSPLATWLHYLENLHTTAIDLGLERVRKVAAALDILKPAPVVFTVGGTNGKGTTCRVIEMAIMAQGMRVGVYSSPHLLRYTERVRIQGTELSDEQHTTAFAAIEAVRGETSLTYFEYSTLAALWLFRELAVDAVVLEVGLGGRLDATNIVDSDIAVITSIGLDHTDWLGPDRESIGREKAGIFRKGCFGIVGEPDMPDTIADVAKQKGAVLLRRGVDWHYEQQETVWSFRDTAGELAQLPMPYVPLPNAATALAALRASHLPLSELALRQAISQAQLPGRFQIVSESPRVILDVAHNPHAANYLVSRLQTLPDTGRILAVVGMLHDKDIGGTLACLSAVVNDWYCAPLGGPRGASAEQLQAHLTTGRAYCNVAEAWRAAMSDARPEDTVLVCGSFHTVADVMAEQDRT